MTALLYATVGFGGGSTYNALLVLADVDFRLIPIIALSCNIFVALGSCFRYQLNGLVPWRFSIPLIVASVPASFIGGSIQISEMIFMTLLGIGLISSGVLMWIRPNKHEKNERKRKHQIYLNITISLLLGLLAGIIGIGGGIFFAPILHLQSALPSKKISAFSSVFILVNSIAG
ncbi:MAG TPA: sulfite exporter TauE/SafE family protein, partial [Gammaproteobacteria bacterium]|nr:sulfite exporter TauE/SafE family protein [Gammaproteobacteria bacterium]